MPKGKALKRGPTLISYRDISDLPFQNNRKLISDRHYHSKPKSNIYLGGYFAVNISINAKFLEVSWSLALCLGP
jgi:hypothetical protein